jgi:hypothetical protein
VTLIALGSLKGSPGVTTTALGLAARWPRGEQPVVVECDPAGGDLLARLRLETSPGLVSLAAAARRGVEPGLVWQHAQRMPGGLPVVVGPAGAEQARAALHQLEALQPGALRRAADRPGTVVLADCGRLDPGTPWTGAARDADVVVILARARDEDLSHVATHLASTGGWPASTCFVLVGGGYPTAEVEDALGLEVTARLPDDPRAATSLGGTPVRRRSALLEALESLAAEVAARAAHRHAPQSAPDGRPKSATLPEPYAETGDPHVRWSGTPR